MPSLAKRCSFAGMGGWVNTFILKRMREKIPFDFFPMAFDMKHMGRTIAFQFVNIQY